MTLDTGFLVSLIWRKYLAGRDSTDKFFPYLSTLSAIHFNGNRRIIMAVKFDLMVATGKYTGKDGTEKTSWLKVGRVMEKKAGGFVMKMDCIPTGVQDMEGNNVAWDGWLQMFEPRPKDSQPQQSAPQQSAEFVPDKMSDVPF